MRLSERLLEALNADRDMNDEEMEVEPREWYPNLMKFYDDLLALENTPTMVNYDRWEIERPPGFHSVGDNLDGI